MLIMRGSLAYSHFRLERLLTQINNIVPYVNSICAEFVHFIDLKTDLTKLENQILSDLLHYGCYATEVMSEATDSPLIITLPKTGMVSTWSSKATDIIKLCGLLKVDRIERGIVYTLRTGEKLTWGDEQAIAELLYDPHNEMVFYRFSEVKDLFQAESPKSIQWADILAEGQTALIKALEYRSNGLFNAHWLVNETLKTDSLLSLIKNTYRLNPRGILFAYEDNAAIIEGGRNGYFFSEPETHVYHYHPETTATIIFSTLSDMNTSVGMSGALRIISAMGRGAKPKAGLCGFSTLNLRIPQFLQPWETYHGKPKEISRPLDIILEASQNCAQFNNEFGCPTICGYFRTYEQSVPDFKGQPRARGYLNPLVLSGGLGSIRQLQIHKSLELSKMVFIVLGGSSPFIEFPSKQSENPEMQRRCQEVVNACTLLGVENPIVSIRSVGRGGLGNSVLELLRSHKLGGRFELRDIPSSDPALSPLEIWCNEAQERYVLMVSEQNVEIFREIAIRESCPFSLIGNTILEPEIQLFDRLFQDFAVRMPIEFLFKEYPKEHYEVSHETPVFSKIDLNQIAIEEAIFRLLRFPCIADKSFLIDICDRTVTGLVVRDPMVGPWQVPVADCAVTVRGFDTYQGEAMAIGERAPLAIINPVASARMAIGEAITNIGAVNIGTLSDVRLVANWSVGHSQDEIKYLYEVVEMIGLAFCPMLGITIAVNQDSESQPVVWQDKEEEKVVTAPLSLVINAFAPVMDVRLVLTPLLTVSEGDTLLIFIDLSGGHQRLGESAIAQVFNQIGDEVPDVEDPKLLKSFFITLQRLHMEGKILAYHDRSDGGLFITLCEMAFASHVGLKIDISELGLEEKSILFNEELGVVIQVYAEDADSILSELEEGGLPNCYVIGAPDYTDQISISFNKEIICSYDRIFLQEAWSETSFQIKSLRDNPRCAKKQYEAMNDREDPGLTPHLTFDPEEDITTPLLNVGARPRVAILREQGTHGHMEMAAAFDRAQFECVDVHMSDLQDGVLRLQDFKGLAVCGGFSFGDVLGAGQGWAKRILFNMNLKDQFEAFFNRVDTFSLGLSNGCQMLSYLKALIPGAELWPNFVQNYSEQFEGRLCLVEVQETTSIFLKDMEGSRLLVPVAHKEGRVEFAREKMQEEALKEGLVALRYVDNRGRKTKIYPANPNGSLLGITGLTTPDGRVLIMMPHPDRAFRTVQYSWHPNTWGEDAPWLRLFRNARKWIG